MASPSDKSPIMETTASHDFAVIDNIPEHEVETERLLYRVMRHLTVNILVNFSDKDLYSDYLYEYEDEVQWENRHALVEEVSSIIHMMATVDHVRCLNISWLEPREQSILHEAMKTIVDKTYINNFLNTTWEEIIQARHDKSVRLDYACPPILLSMGPGDCEEVQKPGHHHLGALYPFRESFIGWMNLKYRANQGLGPNPPKYYWMEPQTQVQRAREKRTRDDLGSSAGQLEYHQARKPKRPEKGDKTVSYFRMYPLMRPQDPEEDDSWKVFHKVTFPGLGNVITKLATNLVENDHPQLRHIPYKRIINACGGPQGIAKRLLGYVDLSIKILDNKEVSVKRLDKIGEDQFYRGIQWHSNSGYLDYVTDDEDEKYWRAYVGQSVQPKTRIAQHLRAAAGSMPQTLHHYIIWKGNGRRSMNFLKLWSIYDIDSLDGESAAIFPNILEMSFSVAFQSLPLDAVMKFYGWNPKRYSNMGLNVLPPLLQGINLQSHIRQVYTTPVADSPDPQIRSWPTFREENRVPDTTVQTWSGSHNMTKWNDYIQLFQSVVGNEVRFAGNNVFESPTTSITSGTGSMGYVLAQEQLSAAISQITREEIHLSYPIGDLTSQIGVIISTCAIDVDDKEKHVPWGIRESGFDESSCLLWFADPRKRSFACLAPTESSDIEDALVRFNKQVICDSALKLIILDGKGTAKYILPGIPPESLNRFQIPLYCGKVSGFFEKEHGKLKRVYFECPSSLLSLWANPGPSAQRIAEIFKFAAALTGTHGIRPYFCNTASAVYHILRIYSEENNGAAIMTESDVNPIIQAFLFRKGFRTSEDIRCLAEIGGTLSRGLLLLLFTLRRKPSEFANARPLELSTTNIHRKGVFTKDQLEKAASLVEAVQPTNYKLCDMVCESLGNINDHEARQVEQLAVKKSDNMKTSSSQEEDHFLEVDGVGSDIACKDMFPTDTGFDMDSCPDSLVFQSEILRRKATTRCQAQRQRMVPILEEEGLKYTGTWGKSTRAIQVHPPPSMASIMLALPGTTKGDLPCEIKLKAEIHSGKKHPNKWALDARDTDPGAKLAFLASYLGNERYIQNHGETNARKANTFMDWVTDCSLEVMRLRPRRHFDAHETAVRQLLNVSAETKPKTYFTDDSCQLWRTDGVLMSKIEQ